MPRPRFAKLDTDRQVAILDAAEEEFAEHGFADASFNRIIEAVGVSKGAMYYYFDDKEDLFAAVLSRAVEDILAVVSPPPAVDSAAAFWQACAQLAARVAMHFASNKRRGRLARVAATSVRMQMPGLRGVMRRVQSYTTAFLARGQQLGAVRDDLALDLIAQFATGVGQAGDAWLAEHIDEMSADEIAKHNATTLELIERVCSPTR